MISSLQAAAFRGACLQLIQPQQSFARMDFQTSLIPRRTGGVSVDVGHRTWPVLIDPESPPSVLQSKNKHHKDDFEFFRIEINTSQRWLYEEA
ncbi:hypothetical protein [Alteribacillus sp. HJP-4]|uniref:hypothetical protein n=1 Tax=Alteribacillus sp. HJP-4 TaxID=2775394 RepID=UPI0035CD2586